MKEDDTTFPLNVNSPLVNFLQRIILWSVNLLALLMTFMVIWTVLDVIFIIYQKSQESFFLLTDIDEILSIFGVFLVVLIAIEIFVNIILYLKKGVSHLKLVMATALMAIARKVIILDYDLVSAWHMAGMGALILALGFAYWFVARTSSTAIIPENNSQK